MMVVFIITSEDSVLSLRDSQSGPEWEGKMTWDLFPVRLAGAGSGDSRTSGHLDQPPLETDCREKLEGEMCFS